MQKKPAFARASIRNRVEENRDHPSAAAHFVFTPRPLTFTYSLQ